MRALTLLFVIVSTALATPAIADTRFFAYDAADALTQGLTRGVTFRAETRFLRDPRLEQLFSTTSRGSALLEPGGPQDVSRVLPSGSEDSALYRVSPEGDGRALANALCPGSSQTWLASGRVRAGRPLVLHAVGVWSDGGYRHCARLSYSFRGEWAQLPRDMQGRPEDAGSPITR